MSGVFGYAVCCAEGLRPSGKALDNVWGYAPILRAQPLLNSGHAR